MSQILAFVSGTGGSGKTTITAQIGKQLAKLGAKTLVIELTSTCSFIGYMYKVADKIVYNINDILEDKCTISNAIIKHNELENLYLIPSSQSVLDIYDDSKIVDLLCYLKSNYDYILLDMDNNNNKNLKIISKIQASIMLITTCDILCIKACSLLADILYQQKNLKCKLIVNKIDRNVIISNKINDIDYIIDSIGIELIGAIPFSLSITNNDMDKINILLKKIFSSIALRNCGKEAPLILKNI